jgi:hypothetical protein
MVSVVDALLPKPGAHPIALIVSGTLWVAATVVNSVPAVVQVTVVLAVHEVTAEPLVE